MLCLGIIYHLPNSCHTSFTLPTSLFSHPFFQLYLEDMISRFSCCMLLSCRIYSQNCANAFNLVFDILYKQYLTLESTNLSISFNVKKSARDREATIACKAVSNDLAANPSVISNVALHTSNRIEENSEKGSSANLPHDAVVSLPGKQGAHTEGTMGLDSPGIAEATRHEQAATKAQAAFRGYLVMLLHET